MKLYNTLTKNIEDIAPIAPPRVTVYTCGPTVYDYPHIGNWFTFVRYDLLVRALQASGLQPEWVMNITDVGHLVSDADEGEDKLEKGAKREGKTAWDVAKFYGDYFTQALKRLNITPPAHLPKATQHIPEQIQLVQTLEAKGYTYTIDDGVYYDTSKFPRYADFARLDIDEQQAGKRVEFNTQKRNTTDFALWKFSPKGQTRDMEWDSPWGKGFPGWHLECSAMSMKYLGETLDIHSGGIDHIPVHHTNEIAQSEAATGKPFANIWMHTNHITVEGDKISKSLGNSITLEDIEAKGFTMMDLRLHILESHYRSQSKFSWESLEAAQNRLQRYYAWADRQFQPQSHDEGLDVALANAHFRHDLLKHAANDLDTPSLLVELEELIDRTESQPLTPGHLEKFKSLLAGIDQLLGLRLAGREDITAEQKQLIAQREKARAEKSWAQSDALRDTLTQQGIGLRDTAAGAIWYRL